MLLALMDEAYTGSTIGDAGVDSESEDSNTIAVAEPLFLELLKDENDGLAVCFYWFMLLLSFPNKSKTNVKHSKETDFASSLYHLFLSC